jgi:hypothetical protein
MLRAVPRLPAALSVVAVALALVVTAAGCARERDVSLELRAASAAAPLLAPGDPVAAVLASEALDCGADFATPLAALCVQVYTLAEGRVVMQAACHDAPGLGGEADLEALLRGLSPLAEGLPVEGEARVYVRILGYADAARTASSLALCGISPSLPGNVDTSQTPAVLPLYLLCHEPGAAPSQAGTVFGDYCGSSDFVAIFP